MAGKWILQALKLSFSSLIWKLYNVYFTDQREFLTIVQQDTAFFLVQKYKAVEKWMERRNY